jgi:hypothetical protein
MGTFLLVHRLHGRHLIALLFLLHDLVGRTTFSTRFRHAKETQLMNQIALLGPQIAPVFM